MTADNQISFAQLCREQAGKIESVTACRDLDCIICGGKLTRKAAFEALAGLLEESERVAALSDQFGPSIAAWRDLIRSMAAGFQPGRERA